MCVLHSYDAFGYRAVIVDWRQQRDVCDSTWRYEKSSARELARESTFIYFALYTFCNSFSRAAAMNKFLRTFTLYRDSADGGVRFARTQGKSDTILFISFHTIKFTSVSIKFAQLGEYSPHRQTNFNLLCSLMPGFDNLLFAATLTDRVHTRNLHIEKWIYGPNNRRKSSKHCVVVLHHPRLYQDCRHLFRCLRCAHPLCLVKLNMCPREGKRNMKKWIIRNNLKWKFHFDFVCVVCASWDWDWETSSSGGICTNKFHEQVMLSREHH